MIAWLDRRIGQIDVLLSPRFLDISSRAAMIDFEEVVATSESPGEVYLGYLPPVELQYWSIDEEMQLARAVSKLDWLMNARPATAPADDQASLLTCEG